jgi:hypothetical protein
LLLLELYYTRLKLDTVTAQTSADRGAVQVVEMRGTQEGICVCAVAATPAIAVGKLPGGRAELSADVAAANNSVTPIVVFTANLGVLKTGSGSSA